MSSNDPELMMQATKERAVADSPNGLDLQNRLYEAVLAYGDFLEQQGLFWSDSDPPKLKASALVVTLNFAEDELNIILKDGPLDRLHGDGVDPDPFPWV